jgi:hypothetical protein
MNSQYMTVNYFRLVGNGMESLTALMLVGP